MVKLTMYTSLIASVVIQIVTGLIEFGSLFFKVPLEYTFLKQMMMLELFVQLIEGTFYVYWLYHFKTISNITPSRYFDWVITTPTMLINLIFYLLFLKYKDTEILDFFKTTLNNSFNDDQITSVSTKPIILYRGIVGMDIHNPEQLEQILHPRAFSSTSTDISTAIKHIEDPSASITRYQQSNVTVILEIHLPSGMKYIDYNKLHPGDSLNEWQNERL
jgi:hypothetical protein